MRCGVQYPDTTTPPPSCPVCEDEREAVPPEGQRWTHPAELGRGHRTEIRTEVMLQRNLYWCPTCQA